MAGVAPISPPPPESPNDQTPPLSAPPRSPPPPPPPTDSLSALSETLALPPAIGSDRDFDCASFSELLAGVMAVNSPEFVMESGDQAAADVGFQGHFEMPCQEVLACLTNKSAEAEEGMERHTMSELSPVSRSEVSLHEEEDTHTQEVDCQNCMPGARDSHIVIAAPTSDRYNWRKYGQKQVKSSESSRSYYRCTEANCHAKKKVQQCDHSGRVIEVIYKGVHNHDPPRNIRSTRSRRSALSNEPVLRVDTDSAFHKLDGSGLSTFHIGEETRQTFPPNPISDRQESLDSANSDGPTSIKVEDNNNTIEARKRIESQTPMLQRLEQRQRQFSSTNEVACIRTKESGLGYSMPLRKTPKEPKIVVQAAGDVGISSDGYRWRKYGQKKVKGTPYPRSYYRCTSAGCPVRKHVEKATEDAAAMVITYEGKHDHDMPVPKKRQTAPCSALVIATTAAAKNAQCKRIETSLNRTSSTNSSVDVEGDLSGEKAAELGGDKALESARTLLSIGIELRPC